MKRYLCFDVGHAKLQVNLNNFAAEGYRAVSIIMYEPRYYTVIMERDVLINKEVKTQ